MDILNKKDFIYYLDREIDYLKSEVKRPGWSKWALIGGIATIFWLILSVVEKSVYNLNNVFLIFLFISIFFDTIYLLSYILLYKNIKLNSQRFILTSNLLSNNRTIIILTILRYLLMIYIINNFLINVIPFVKILAYLINIIFVIIYLISLIISYIKLPFPKQSNPYNLINFIPNFILLVICIIFIKLILPIIINNNYDITIPEVRLASLSISIYILILILLRSPKDIPIINSLIDIRRKLVLGELKLADAIKNSEIALIGLKISDVFHEYVEEFINSLNRLDSLLNRFTIKFEIMEKLYIESNYNLNNEQKEIAESIRESLYQISQEAEEYTDKHISKSFYSFSWRYKFVNNILKSRNTELDEIYNKTKSAVKEVKSNSNSIKLRFSSFIGELEKKEI